MRPRPRAAHRPVTWPRGQRVRQALAGALAGALALPVQLPAEAAQTPAEAEPEAEPEAPTPPDAAAQAPPAELAPAIAQAEALRLFRAARARYNLGEFRQAALGFEASFKAFPSPEAAYNAALAHDRVPDRVATLRWFRRYLAIARRDSDPSYPLAVQRAQDLSARLGELSLRIDHPESLRELRVNGVAVAVDAFPLLLEPGRVELRFIGERPDQVVDITSEIPAGGPATVHFPGFTSAPGSQPAPPPVVQLPRATVDPRAVPRHRALQRLLWAGVGLTSASAVAVGVLGGLTLRSRSDYIASQVPMVPIGEGAANQAAQAHFHDLRLATNAMSGVAAGLAVITLALGIVTLQHGRRLRASASAPRLRVASSGLQLAF